MQRPKSQSGRKKSATKASKAKKELTANAKKALASGGHQDQRGIGRGEHHL
jgi:hypothetical protein